MRKIYFKTLDSDRVKLLQHIPVCFTQNENGFLIWCENSNITGSGKTLVDACDFLKSLIVDLYFFLKDYPEDKLGPQMKIKKQFLMEHFYHG